MNSLQPKQSQIENLSNELYEFISEIELKATNGETLVQTFNHFMSENKINYFRNIKKIFQTDHLQQMKQEEIFDRIQLKTVMLNTLEKEVKVLENRRCEIEAQNEQLKV